MADIFRCLLSLADIEPLFGELSPLVCDYYEEDNADDAEITTLEWTRLDYLMPNASLEDCLGELLEEVGSEWLFNKERVEGVKEWPIPYKIESRPSSDGLTDEVALVKITDGVQSNVLVFMVVPGDHGVLDIYRKNLEELMDFIKLDRYLITETAFDTVGSNKI